MWIIIEYLHLGKATALGFVSGILTGLVAVTPAAGVVQPIGALVLGAVASLICYYAIIMKTKLGYDDSLDAFGIHGVGGVVGALLLTFFIRNSWIAEATALSNGGWSVWLQLGVQAAAVFIAIAYATIGTLIILWVVDKTVGMRSKTQDELQGLDYAYHGERGYGMLNPN
jgi:Amt family ammonium transporter